jgi:hypothetical protein
MMRSRSSKPDITTDPPAGVSPGAAASVIMANMHV